MLKQGGTAILFGLNGKAKSNILQYDLTRNNIKIIGSHIGSGKFPKTIKLIYDKKIDVSKILGTKLNLLDIQKGINMLKRKETTKIIITF